MSDRESEHSTRPSLAYRAGRAAAPHAARARWFWTSLTGSADQQLAAEEELGRHLLAAYRQQAPADDDPAVRRRLQSQYDRLCAGMAARRRRFCVEGSLEPITNAFALPGGIVLLTRPLLELCDKDDDALAFVIAHEMGHIVRRHAMDRYLASTSAQTIARLIPARSPITAVLRGQLSRMIVQGYSRNQELEADDYGIRLVRAAGFDPDGAVRLLRALGAHDSGDDPFPYFRSHPPTAERIRKITAA